MSDTPGEARPRLAWCVALFTGIYVPLLFLAGLAKLHLGMGTDLDAPVLLTAGAVAGRAFVAKSRRLPGRREILLIALGAFVVDVALQLGVVFLLLGPVDHSADALLAFVMMLRFVGLVFAFGPLTRIAAKPILGPPQ